MLIGSTSTDLIHGLGIVHLVSTGRLGGLGAINRCGIVLGKTDTHLDNNRTQLLQRERVCI